MEQEGTAVKWLAHYTSDLKVGGSRPGVGRHVVSSDKELYFSLSLSTQVCKWVPATKCRGGGGGAL